MRSALGRGLVCAVLFVPVFMAPPASATTRTDLTLQRTTSGTPVTGTKVKFTGTAPNGLRGKRVKLQRSIGTKGKWVTLASPKVSTSGTISTSGRAAGIGLNRWRLFRSGSAVTHRSSVRKTTVFKWFNLSRLSYVDSNRFDEGGASIAGRNYTRSVMNSTKLLVRQERLA